MLDIINLEEAKKTWGRVEKVLTREEMAPVIPEKRQQYYTQRLSKKKKKAFDNILKERSDYPEIVKKTEALQAAWRKPKEILVNPNGRHHRLFSHLMAWKSDSKGNLSGLRIRRLHDPDKLKELLEALEAGDWEAKILQPTTPTPQGKYELCLMPEETKSEEAKLEPEPGKLYLGEKAGKITYTLITVTGEIVRNVETNIPAPPRFNLKTLAPLKNVILGVTSNAGHTPNNRNFKKGTQEYQLGLLAMSLYASRKISRQQIFTLLCYAQTVKEYGLIKVEKVLDEKSEFTTPTYTHLIATLQSLQFIPPLTDTQILQLQLLISCLPKSEQVFYIISRIPKKKFDLALEERDGFLPQEQTWVVPSTGVYEALALVRFGDYFSPLMLMLGDRSIQDIEEAVRKGYRPGAVNFFGVIPYKDVHGDKEISNFIATEHDRYHAMMLCLAKIIIPVLFKCIDVMRSITGYPFTKENWVLTDGEVFLLWKRLRWTHIQSLSFEDLTKIFCYSILYGISSPEGSGFFINPESPEGFRSRNDDHYKLELTSMGALLLTHIASHLMEWQELGIYTQYFVSEFSNYYQLVNEIYDQLKGHDPKIQILKLQCWIQLRKGRTEFEFREISKLIDEFENLLKKRLKFIKITKKNMPIFRHCLEEEDKLIPNVTALCYEDKYISPVSRVYALGEIKPIPFQIKILTDLYRLKAPTLAYSELDQHVERLFKPFNFSFSEKKEIDKFIEEKNLSKITDFLKKYKNNTKKKLSGVYEDFLIKEVIRILDSLIPNLMIYRENLGKIMEFCEEFKDYISEEVAKKYFIEIFKYFIKFGRSEFFIYIQQHYPSLSALFLSEKIEHPIFGYEMICEDIIYGYLLRDFGKKSFFNLPILKSLKEYQPIYQQYCSGDRCLLFPALNSPYYSYFNKFSKKFDFLVVEQLIYVLENKGLFSFNRLYFSLPIEIREDIFKNKKLLNFIFNKAIVKGVWQVASNLLPKIDYQFRYQYIGEKTFLSLLCNRSESDVFLKYFVKKIKDDQDEKDTLIGEVIRNDDVKSLEILLEEKSDFDPMYYNKLLLPAAIKHNSFKIASALLEHKEYKVDINQPDFRDMTPLMKAIGEKNQKMIALLIDHHVDLRGTLGGEITEEKISSEKSAFMLKLLSRAIKQHHQKHSTKIPNYDKEILSSIAESENSFSQDSSLETLKKIQEKVKSWPSSGSSAFFVPPTPFYATWFSSLKELRDKLLETYYAEEPIKASEFSR